MDRAQWYAQYMDWSVAHPSEAQQDWEFATTVADTPTKEELLEMIDAHTMGSGQTYDGARWIEEVPEKS